MATSWFPARLPVVAALAALTGLLGPARADAPGPASSEPGVRYFRTTYLGTVDGRIYLRGRFQVTGPTGREYGVFFQLRPPSKEIMRFEGFPEGRVWGAGDVVAPAGQTTASWVRDVSIPVSDLAAATNLPRGQRIEVWAQCDLWDRARQKYLGFGGGKGPTFLVSTDPAGRVLEVGDAEPPGGPIKGPEQGLRTRHLQLREGVKVYREATPFGDGPVFPVAGRRRYTGDLGLFQPVDTPAKARELAELRLAGHWVVPTREQYRALRDALGRTGVMFVVAPGEPPSCGLTVEPGQGGSFVARALTYLPRSTVVYHQEMVIWPDGRIEGRSVALVTNGWYEGWPSQPALSPEWREAWDRAARAALGPGAPEVVPDRVVPPEGR